MNQRTTNYTTARQFINYSA